MGMDLNLGWLTKASTVKMVRKNFPNLVDYTNNEVLEILGLIGIKTEIDINAPMGKITKFYFSSFRDEYYQRLTHKGMVSEVAERISDNTPDWDDRLRSQPPKQKSK
jgi:hypothetical protein